MEYELTQDIINNLIKSQVQGENLLNNVNNFINSEVEKYNVKLLEGILKGIPDIIRVFDLDERILFLNEAGYNFYRKNLDEVKGKKCFEILGRKEKCNNCEVEEAIKTKNMIRVEKYVPEFNKYMECTCNPVLDDYGQVIFVVEQLKDITDRRILANTVKESEERYRKIVNLSPEAIIITVDNKIVLANNQACKLVGGDYSDIIGQNIYKYIPANLAKVTKKRLRQILEDKKTKTSSDTILIRYDYNLIEVEISSSYLTYKGKPAVQSVIRNITEMKKGLNHAAKFQRKYLETKCPFPDKIKMESLYMPARTVSGDFFRVYKVSEDLVMGILFDVSGKGITAALSVLAFFVLFREAILVSHDPVEIINNLNNKIADYLEERYIAACCFSFDFKKNEAKIVGAGINQFIFQKNKCRPQELIIKGPFLGMFEDSVFDEQIISFEQGDRFYFLTDGLEFVFHDNELMGDFLTSHTITEFKNYLKNMLDDMLTNIDGLKDDSTIIALEIK